MNVNDVDFMALMEARVHLGHRASYWNPRMEPYIHCKKKQIHIIDLNKTVVMLHKAVSKAYHVASKNGVILFVSTKPSISSIVADYASSCAQYHVTHRWLGGMITNWRTVLQSIKKFKKMRSNLDMHALQYITKKEKNISKRWVDRSSSLFEGIEDMPSIPNLVIIIDTFQEGIAVRECQKAQIQTIGIVDTNCDPRSVTYPVPGNTSSMYSAELYCKLFSHAIVKGLSKYHSLQSSNEVKNSVFDIQGDIKKDPEGKGVKTKGVDTALSPSEEGGNVSMPSGKEAFLELDKAITADSIETGSSSDRQSVKE